MQLRTNNQGFTLLEMTLALGVFVVLFTLTLGIYSASIKAEQRTIQISKLQNEAQLIMEILAKKIRSSKIDYAYYAGPLDSGGENTLALLDQLNNQTVFRFDVYSGSLSVCTLDCVGSGVFVPIPPNDVIIDNLIFFINPLTDPFRIDSPPLEYPKVTIVMKLENTRGENTQSLLIQQTIPQRLPGL